jgi:oligopeptidase B
MKNLLPPKPQEKPQKISVHGDTRVDEFSWLRDREDPSVMKYVQAENDYADAVMRPTLKLQRELFREIKARMKEDDMSVPVKDGPYLYYSRTKKGKQYAIHCRKLAAGGKEEVILDENALAKGEKYFSLGTLDVSPDHSLLAYTVDTQGNEKHTLYIKDLATGKLRSEHIDSVADVEWAEDGLHIFYSVEDHPHPPRKIFLHRLDEDSSRDVLVFEEKDPQWYVGIDKSKSRAYIFFISAKFDTTEVRCIPAHNPHAPLRLFAPRKQHVKYFVDHHAEYFYIMSNERAVNFKIMRTRTETCEKKYWKTWLAHDIRRPITGLLIHDSFFALSVRERGTEEIYLHPAGSPRGKRLKFPEGEHTLVLWTELEYLSDFIRVTYQSFVTPRTVFDIDAKTHRAVVRKEQSVPGYDRKKYVSKREWVLSGSVRVPVTLVYAKKTKLNGKAPLMLEAYGAYGITHDPTFSISRPSLLDRGWVVAYAHVRGGGEMGWHWHETAKLLTKHRTYEDVIACAQFLQKKYGARERMVLVGGSAGGMMVGAVLNMRPDLFGAAIAYVPAADIITSLFDESLGGTRLHYDEVGDPRLPNHYRYMKKYSPYEGVRPQNYPPLLVRSNMNDIRTPYWEAAKWVARLRSRKTDHNLLLSKTEIVAGHFGKSGRYEWIKDRAFDFAFLMQVLGLAKE